MEVDGVRVIGAVVELDFLHVFSDPSLLSAVCLLMSLERENTTKSAFGHSNLNSPRKHPVTMEGEKENINSLTVNLFFSSSLGIW